MTTLPDLKQCVLDLITTCDGDLPLFMRVGSGNEADKAVFGKILVEFNRQINFESIMVCDSALYSQENLKLIEHLKWISRVPLTIKKAKDLVQNVATKDLKSESEAENSQLKLSGYKWHESLVNYGGIQQVWLVVSSENRQKSDLAKLEKNRKNDRDKAEKMLKDLQGMKFEHPEVARYKLTGINRKLHLFEIAEVELIESHSKGQQTIYKMTGVVREKTEEIAKRSQEAGRFILATNLVGVEPLKPSEILIVYKNQQSCERGFRFLKDPLFFADSFFVENPERIETMLFLMSLCLLVYNLGQRELRNSLKRDKAGVKSQVGKFTNSPTLRWIFQCFQGIHLVTLNGVQQIINLTEERHSILNFLPSSCQKYYL